ncbi:MAG TPA: NUDIX domain-containing protein [Candidatus Paceibacterota bacterium]|jgi:8-oxo-dGTP pyrophosphatase MutT (NUDIX family)
MSIEAQGSPQGRVRIRAAGGIVLNDQGRIAMVRHKNGRGTWFFPKGRVEEGEDEETTARREILEETGLDNLEYLDDFGVYERYHLNPEGGVERDEIKEIHMFLFAVPGNVELSPTHEIGSAKWVPLSKIAEECGSMRDRAWFATVYDRIWEAIERD